MARRRKAIRRRRDPWRRLLLHAVSTALGVAVAWWLLDMPSLWVEGAATVQSVSLGEPEIRLQSSSVQGVELSALGSEDDDSSASIDDPAPPAAGPAAPVSSVAAQVRSTVAAKPTAASPTIATGFTPEVPRMRPRTPPVRLAARVPPATAASSERASASSSTPTKPSVPLAKPVSVAAAPDPRLGEGDRKIVQVAASGQGQRAGDLAAELRRKGFDSYVLEVQDDPSGLRYKVRVRPQTGEAAQALVERLRRGGRDGWITTQ